MTKLRRYRKSSGPAVAFAVKRDATLIATPNTGEGFLLVGGICLAIGCALKLLDQ